MRLPAYIEEKLSKFYYEIGKQKVVKTRKSLTESYSQDSGRSVSLIKSREDAVIYAISRMPATYSVIYSLILKLTEQNMFQERVNSVADFGSGTGAGFFALNELFENAQISLFEKDESMLEIFNLLTDSKIKVNKLDLCEKNEEIFAQNFSDFKSFDLCVSCYVLSEMTEEDRIVSFKNLLSKTKNYLLLIDTGTPRVYSDYMKLKDMAEELGFSTLAPCVCEKCPLKDDYCQFYARVERSFELRQSKQAKESYEDEKYFYLLLKRKNLGSFEEFSIKNKTSGNEEFESCRVIRRPKYEPNRVELVLCTKSGVVCKTFTKKQKEIYKLSRKAKINDLVKIV